MKKYIALFLCLINFSGFAADDNPIYEREDVPTTAKVSSVIWTFGGAVVTTGLSLWKLAPLHRHMEPHEWAATSAITCTSLFVGALLGAYGGKKFGQYIDPSIQYWRLHNWMVRKVTSGINFAWNVSSYYSSHAMYKWDHIRRTHLQGTFFALKDPQ